jgi:hypothetical protein
MILPLLAPLLATLASNGLGMVADAVTKKGKEFVEEKLGIDLTQDPSPETIANWKLAAQQHEKELLQMAYGDVANARNMQVEALRFIYIFATFWSVFAASYIGFITFGHIPEDNQRFADTILGFLLGTVVATILQFFFGSSMGSKEKDKK